MRVVVTGSSGHLGEALAQTLREAGHSVLGVDLRDGEQTDRVGSIADRALVRSALAEAEAVVHTATLHKPHVATHSRHDFLETNVAGTLNLLEEAVANKVGRFVFTSTTSTFGRSLVPAPGAPAAWITESVPPAPKNIYGVTKVAAESLCELFHQLHGLPCIVLRTSRFFPDEDDRHSVRDRYADENIKVNEFLYRRVELSDAVEAHRLALDRAVDIGFGRYIISATTPFVREDLPDLRDNLPSVVDRLFPERADLYERHGWRMFGGIDRVYVNERAREELGWRPRFDFGSVLERIRDGRDIWSPMARSIGVKGYHDEAFSEGPYPVAE